MRINPPKVHGHEVPLIVEGAPEIEDWSLREKFGGAVRHLIAERVEKLRRTYDEWRSSAYRLPLGTFLMSQTSRVGAMRTVQLLQLADGKTVLQFHHASLSIYKGGYYIAIGEDPRIVYCRAAPYLRSRREGCYL